MLGHYPSISTTLSNYCFLIWTFLIYFKAFFCHTIFTIYHMFLEVSLNIFHIIISIHFLHLSHQLLHFTRYFSGRFEIFFTYFCTLLMDIVTIDFLYPSHVFWTSEHFEIFLTYFRTFFRQLRRVFLHIF